ncbi:hypothetical protein AtubIFM56815_008648 [Aspergillus tubingensis]|uniref:Uncharacterized protein n=1 Tax=Aspergillus tubingensis TaxID=5068 RepID=A0A9W6EMF2_ASPTU|nr:hypothetical protein AtubIFM54640_007473 [Aspergillus tubingensis]GLA84435.1 hypothetical protein AtubIFM56815_008648 [Aspergillus tubingensis]
MTYSTDSLRTTPPHSNTKKLTLDRMHPLVMHQQNRAHVIEVSETDLTEHIRTQSAEFSLVQLKTDLMDLFQDLSVMIDQ